MDVKKVEKIRLSAAFLHQIANSLYFKRRIAFYLEFRWQSGRLQSEGRFKSCRKQLERAGKEVIVVEGEHRAVVVRRGVHLQLAAGVTVVQVRALQLE